MRGYSHLKIIARVMIVALAIFLFIHPVGWAGGLIIFAAASLLYCSVNFYIEYNSDRRAIEVLTKRFEKSGYNHQDASFEATKAALQCLQKIALQNIDKRVDSKLCKLLITKSGNLRFDPSVPPLTHRIQKLEKSFAIMMDKQKAKAVNPHIRAATRILTAPEPTPPVKVKKAPSARKTKLPKASLPIAKTSGAAAIAAATISSSNQTLPTELTQLPVNLVNLTVQEVSKLVSINLERFFGIPSPFSSRIETT